MTIRQATEQDIPQIIELLKLSLGESLMPKSEAYWRWKHIKNPFGKSPVLLAIENNQVIGVRAFMQWQWQSKKGTLKAVRAVDTVTHPAHQGKGIFKTLTLDLLKQCKADNIDFVFNTPNNQSKPGYLKMGWEEVGKLPIQLSIKKPLNVLASKLGKNKKVQFIQLDHNQYNLNDAITAFTVHSSSETEELQTNYSTTYLKWRYADIPIIPYYGSYKNDALIIFRLKESGLGVELRICDSFGNPNEIKDLLTGIYKNCIFDYLSHSGLTKNNIPGLIKTQMSIGPEVTKRAINEDLISKLNFSYWKPTLGDLEVF